ncbi:GDYXXLXY domain-containing protein [Sulfurospirillum oryzae]|uniref:GDYXXLXY domain-containing protein n=1 Tax=Sulfurospirillum oryzae TaxID=2976535 RepID=UPI0021E776A7|nr:GDYXXLXY domain-containing protein [Sulfurospirillum oryzae]
MRGTKLFLGIVFGVLCVVQLGAILFQMMSYERILKEGEVFYFKVLPLDPYDPFRGRYVTLRFENATKAPLASNESMDETSPKGYALLEHQEKGDAIKEVRFSKPANGHFLEVNVQYINQGSVPKSAEKPEHANVYFSLPFDRFYMREDIAPKAEKVLRARSGVSVKAKLRVLGGKGVIEDLVVGETPLSQFVQSE